MSNGKQWYVLLGAILLLLSALFFACGGGGDGGGNGGGVVGFSFDNNNMMVASGNGVEIADFFSGLSSVNALVLEALFSAAPAPPVSASPLAVFPIPLTGFCDNEPAGSAALSWDDGDGNLQISAGDTGTLTFTNCFLPDTPVDGTATFTFVEVNGISMIPDNVTVDLALNITASDIDTVNFAGTIRFFLSAPGLTSFHFLYGGVDRSDFVNFTINGTEAYKFGCFDIEFSIPDISFPETFDSRPRGIANVEGKIMQLGSYFVPDQILEFQPVIGFPDPVPVMGTLTLLSFDGRPSFGLPACTAVGSAGNINTNNREILITATGGGNVRVELKQSTGAVISTVDTTWDALFP